ncbi:N-acetylglucosamine-6-phosphate deacetylase [hydrothermal vent metagenome]|uniref:N-acetylglucosamine-6-phosphate deacetylase n=1 Tax=hydrothermal vent metagenome TaxID=652676 RepID=A0A3B1D1X8_9ZZZZ
MKIIDIHTHGIGGYDTRTAAAEDILKMAEIHGRQGISEIVPTVYPAAIEVMRGNMAAIRAAMEGQKAVACRGEDAAIAGINLEGPFLNPLKCGALDVRAFLEASEYNLEKLIEGFEDIIRIMTIAPEIEGAEGLIRTITGMGIIVSMGHSDATYAEAERGFHSGARGITHLFNAMRGIHHREPGIAGFGLLNRDIFIELIADPFHLHERTIELVFKVKNPERIIVVSDSVKQTQTSSKSQEGITEGNGRLSGGCMTVIESSRRLTGMGFDTQIVMRCITENPERYLH